MSNKNEIQIEEKIDFLKDLLLKMVTRVEEAILKATVAFRDHDIKMAEKVVADDFYIDEMRELIENDAVMLLISEAPYGHYMRYVIAGLKMVTSLERMGDHAAHLARLTASMSTAQKTCDAEIVKKIVAMANADAAMFREVISALATIDAQRAIEIAKMDNEIDTMEEENYRLILAANARCSREGEPSMELFEFYYITKELERLGDHVTTICKWIVYMKEGEKPQLN